MKSLMFVAFLSAGCATAGWADEPASPGGVKSTETRAADATTAATAPPATTPAAAAPDKSALAAAEQLNIRKVREQGYKPEKRKDGTTYWCRNEATLGTRFETKTCSTVEQILQRQKDAQEDVDKVQRQLGVSPYKEHGQ
jgi:hypothetical protein